MKKNLQIIYISALLLSIAISSGCRKFVEVNAPDNTINIDNVYASDATAIAVLTGVYTNFSLENDALRFVRNGLTFMSVYPGLSADELTLYDGASNPELINYYQNKINSEVLSSTDFWSRTYKYIFVVNSSINGLTKSQTLTTAVKNQLLGESYFLRAFCYFYLVNLYGDVPLITSTDYVLSSPQARETKDNVYKQIISDLLEAEKNLNQNFVDITAIKTSQERVRPSRSAAIALLARVYLYAGDWANAETLATKLITDNVRFSLVDLDQVFKKNSKETIWALQPVSNDVNSNTGDGRLFIIPEQGPWELNQFYLSDDLLNNFDSGDQRFTHWVNQLEINGVIYYYAFKYKIGEVPTANSEYSMVLRLAEQYLIRAEARIQQNKTADGIADLNALRSRATDIAESDVNKQLKQLPANLSKEQALTAVLHERQTELFTEWGHRWLDLKRSGTIDQIMPAVSQKKGGTWSATDALFAIPLKEVQANKNLIQNKGY
ncbi:MAG: RagB/SusD family nutrient uptake outer membrane protein [Bacteroidota bacterium]